MTYSNEASYEKMRRKKQWAKEIQYYTCKWNAHGVPIPILNRQIAENVTQYSVCQSLLMTVLSFLHRHVIEQCYSFHFEPNFVFINTSKTMDFLHLKSVNERILGFFVNANKGNGFTRKNSNLFYGRNFAFTEKKIAFTGKNFVFKKIVFIQRKISIIFTKLRKKNARLVVTLCTWKIRG